MAKFATLINVLQKRDWKTFRKFKQRGLDQNRLDTCVGLIRDSNFIQITINETQTEGVLSLSFYSRLAIAFLASLSHLTPTFVRSLCKFLPLTKSRGVITRRKEGSTFSAAAAQKWPSLFILFMCHCGTLSLQLWSRKGICQPRSSPAHVVLLEYILFLMILDRGAHFLSSRSEKKLLPMFLWQRGKWSLLKFNFCHFKLMRKSKTSAI